MGGGGYCLDRGSALAMHAQMAAALAGVRRRSAGGNLISPAPLPGVCFVRGFILNRK
jgi:hypothetical protein